MGQAFLEQYGRVFDSNGDIRNCGRAAAIRLIELADGLEPGIRHGDTRTGFMYTDKMKELRDKATK